MPAVSDTPDDPPSRKCAKPTVHTISDVGLAAGDRIEVCWQLERDGSDDPVPVWWGGSVHPPADAEEDPDSYRLQYDAAHGFQAEERRVVFGLDGTLWDASNKEMLDWRPEGAWDEAPEEDEEEAEPEAAAFEGGLAIGTAVRSRSGGGDMQFAGTIHAAHPDGTFDVLYESQGGVLEQNVPREMITVVDIAPAVQAAIEEGGETVAESINDFFDLFVTSLTSGAKFAALSAERQQVAAYSIAYESRIHPYAMLCYRWRRRRCASSSRTSKRSSCCCGTSAASAAP
jgi:hypothetical protein